MSSPNVLFAIALSALSLGRHFSLAVRQCSLNDIEVSYLTPSSVTDGEWGIGVLLMVSCGVYLCSLVWLVRSVAVDFVGAILSLLVLNHWFSVLR